MDVCRSHGGATKLSKRAAQERMMELVWPALARLDQLVNDPDTDPAIVVKVVTQILDRAHSAGLTRHAQVGVSLEPSPFDILTGEGSPAFILRSRADVIDPADEPEALPPSGGVDDEVLDDLLDRRDRMREREADTRLRNDGHDVVRGRVMDENLTTDSGSFGYPKSRETHYRESGGSEHDPDGTRPSQDAWTEYERRIVERTSDPRPRRR